MMSEKYSCCSAWRAVTRRCGWNWSIMDSRSRPALASAAEADQLVRLDINGSKSRPAFNANRSLAVAGWNWSITSEESLEQG